MVKLAGSKIKYIVGIDEVGRGPLAGPFTVGAVAIPFVSNLYMRGVQDSKQLIHEERELIFKKINILKEQGKLRHAISHIKPHVLDKIGLTKTALRAVARCLKKLKIEPQECMVLLDGGLKAPDKFLNQKTIIKGDEKIKVIALASIVAKVTRDRILVRLSKKYPQYDFHIHKGYATRAHYEKLKEFGPCEIHRKLFLRKFFRSRSAT